MKTLCPVDHRRSEHSDSTNFPIERPIKICVVFDEEDCAQKAEVLIRHAASNYECDTQSFRFDELDPPAPSVAAAHSACDADILVLALRDDRVLPHHVQLWLGLCVSLRDEHQEGALVVFTANELEAASSDSDSLLFEKLEAVAAIGGLTIFFGGARVKVAGRAFRGAPADVEELICGLSA